MFDLEIITRNEYSFVLVDLFKYFYALHTNVTPFFIHQSFYFEMQLETSLSNKPSIFIRPHKFIDMYTGYDSYSFHIAQKQSPQTDNLSGSMRFLIQLLLASYSPFLRYILLLWMMQNVKCYSARCDPLEIKENGNCSIISLKSVKWRYDFSKHLGFSLRELNIWRKTHCNKVRMWLVS